MFTSRNVRSVRISWSTTTAMIGPKSAAPAAGQAHPAQDDGRDAEQRVRPRYRRPDPGARRQREPGDRGEEPGEGVRRDPRPIDRHAAAEGRQPVAADGIQGQAELRASERAARSTATMTSMITVALGIHSLPSGPDDEILEPLRRATAGRRPDESANPAHTNDIASVTTMSGTLVVTTSTPLTAPSDQPEQQRADHDDDRELFALALHQRRGHDARERHHRTDRQVDAAGDDDHRLGHRGERERQHRRCRGPGRRRLRSSAG